MRNGAAKILLLYSLVRALDVYGADESISIHGNTRTRTSYIKRLVQECEENFKSTAREGSEEEELRQCLMNSRLFSKVLVNKTQDGFDIEVEDKWTLIPIPSISAGSDNNKSVGLFLFESNFLGVGMNLAVGGTKSDRGTSYFGILVDPSLFGSRWTYSLTASKSEQRILAKVSEKIVDGFEEDVTTYKGTLGYRFRYWSLSGLVAVGKASYENHLAYTVPLENDFVKVGAILGFDNRDYKLYYSEGLAFNLTITQDSHRSDEEKAVKQISSNLNWAKATFADQVLQISLLQGTMEGGSKADLFRIGRANGFRGIEATTAWVDRYYAAALDYQFPIKNFESGAFTVGPFLDAGRLYGPRDEKPSDYVSSGLGFYYYLSRVAFPGVGLQFGYNEKFEGQYFSVFVGFAR